MSESRIAIEEAASRSGMPGSCFKVLLTLLRIRGRKASAWPSVERIAKQSGMGVRTAQLAIARLEEAGWVKRLPRHHETWFATLHVGTEIARVRPAHWRRLGVQPVATSEDPIGGATLSTLGVQHVAPKSFIESFSSPQTPQGGLVDEPQSEPSPTPENVVTYRRPGPLSPDPEQRAASYEAVNETPQSRGSRNLAAHEGPPTPPPPYRYKGVDLPGRISDLLPREVAAALAVHFKGDRYRSGTQKLCEAKSLDYMRGLTSIAIEDIAIHMDIHWRVRPPALKDLAVPYVAGGEDVRWDAERLYMHLSGRLLPNAELQQLIPDAGKRRPILDLLRELGAESVPAGWAELGRQIREAQARAVNQ